MKKIRIRLLLLLLCSLLLCGCVRGGASPAAPDAAPAVTGAVPAESAVPAPEEDVSAQEGASEKRIETLSRQEDIPVFSEMEYERPSLEEMDKLILAAEEAMDAGADFETLEPLLDDCFLRVSFETIFRFAQTDSL